MNINDHVRVRHTPEGDRIALLNATGADELGGRWQLWRLLQVFGEFCYMGGAQLFERNEITPEVESPVQQQFDIGRAVTEMRHHGNKVRRAGWNGKGMYLVFQKAYPDGIPINENTAQSTGIPKGTVCAFLPYVMMRTADGAFVPWLCSQTDLLATDWEIAL